MGKHVFPDMETVNVFTVGMSYGGHLATLPKERRRRKR